MTEAQFQRQIVEYATLRGWRLYHTYDSRRSAYGWPDLFLCRAERAVAIEVKSERGKVTAAQEEWLLALQYAGIQALVVKPSGWDTILRLLA